MTHGLIFQDEADAISYWSTREWKKWAVHIVAGPARKPTFKRTTYVRARSAQAALAVARRDTFPPAPRSASFDARLAGPSELGCVTMPSGPHRLENPTPTPNLHARFARLCEQP
ncbi:hypothetical protein [Variovorax saccharolyticus]|uniref:hypothetical protein n=1 Tax=Variovorax saccharolyticus TaxID=3053516 RepID=UPI002578B65D|nr:hypothetical protein [Variovorax sp. J31P216]MDM0029147.1 hypothetical protein [Variovorax sp. J31P216]